ncbi:MAG: chromophore lyase CpcT/CpeT, partial [Pseudomonadota bacterium]
APLSDAEALGAMMTDIFETAPDDPDNDIRDRRVRIESPDFSGVWLYYQLNTGPEKQVYRQRVIELINQDGVVVQKTYGLKDPDMFVDAWDKPTLLSSMSLSDIEPFFDEGCEQVWRRAQDAWRGAVNRETCRIFSARRQAHIFIEAEARLDETTYKQTERGYDEDGEKLFGGEPGEFIVLYRK